MEPFPWTELIVAGSAALLGVVIRWLEKRKMKRKSKRTNHQ